MTREEFIKIVDSKVKLIRNEKGYTQDKMSDVLGISKKTLVQIEKGRCSLGWTTAIAACTIFKDSEILQLAFGGEAEDIILSLAFNGYEKAYEKTLGGNIWWRDIEFNGIYKIQQNIISKHYRILNDKDRRICSSFELDYIRKRLNGLNQ
ncbi:helix-turn-helix transcriptional regulator [Clostridium sp. WILCCON 0269]|uniref:Helix-turn-helix transcriptional regulator n=1 Tax=Candidatus Clostridium eludens TaxID=3381663 RepID=A0ABW8SJF4_9CLOT